MRSGKLDRRITVQVRSVTRDATGGEVETWTNAYDIWAERETTGATERFAASQRIADVDTLFRIRWNDDVERLVTPQSHRITYRGRWYEVLGVVEIGRREGLWLPTKSRGDLGGVP